MAPVSLPSKSPAPLMPFTYEWIGGDIHGLSAYAGTMYGYVPKIADTVNALDSKLSQVVSDAGWQDGAASAFGTNWEKVPAEVNSVGLVITDAGTIVDQLAADLAKIENALEKAATAAGHGIQVGGNGQPPQQCYADTTKESWRQGYDSFYSECLKAGEAALALAGRSGGVAIDSLGFRFTTPEDLLPR